MLLYVLKNHLIDPFFLFMKVNNLININIAGKTLNSVGSLTSIQPHFK